MSRVLDLDYKSSLARISALPLELTGAACAGAALLVLACLCWRTRLRRRQLRAAGPPLLGGQLPEQHRARLLELQFYLRSCLQYRAVRLLPQVAARDDVALALVEPDDDDLRDEAARSSGVCSTVVRSLCGREPDAYVLTMFPCAHAPFLHDTRDLLTLQRLLLGPPGAPAHPRLQRMRSFEFLPASGMVAGVRRWSAAGSLRDLIHGVSPEGAHRLKYGRVGVPLSETKCCTYGYHLLQARARAQAFLACLSVALPVHAHPLTPHTRPRRLPHTSRHPPPASCRSCRFFRRRRSARWRRSARGRRRTRTAATSSSRRRASSSCSASGRAAPSAS